MLARAYLRALAARVGLTCAVPEPDHGIDFTLREVTPVTDARTGEQRYLPTGVPLDVQLKATTNAIVCDHDIKHALEVRAYDILRVVTIGAPRILILHVQPKKQHEWLKLTPEGLTLGGLCYWMSLRGRPAVPDRSKVPISIPRSNLLSETGLEEIMRRIANGEVL